jgi:hypothetical protein
MMHFFWYAVLTIGLLGCTTSPAINTSTAAAEVLEATRKKMAANATHTYRVRSSWDNRFAKNTYADTVDVMYTSFSDGENDFGFHIKGSDFAVIYDGEDELKIEHATRKIVRTTATEIAADPAYFKHKLFFLANPRELLDLEGIDQGFDTIIAGENYFVYRIFVRSPVAAAPSKTMVVARTYFLDPSESVLQRIQKASYVDRDTVQVVDYFFSNYTFSPAPYRFDESDLAAFSGYREVNRAVNKKERLSGLVRSGDQLTRADYTDINGQEQLLYGNAGEKTVIMFSFIGCGGCEYALKEMRKKSYRFRSDINFAYSSSVDQAAAIRTYLQRKEFSHLAFDKSSRMNDNFRAAAFPTFVVISEEGQIEQVIGGYDQSVEWLLFAD